MTDEELRTKILKEALVKSSVVRWEKNKGEPIKQSNQQIVEIPIDDLMSLIATHYKALEAEIERIARINGARAMKDQLAFAYLGDKEFQADLARELLDYESVVNRSKDSPS